MGRQEIENQIVALQWRLRDKKNLGMKKANGNWVFPMTRAARERDIIRLQDELEKMG